MKKIILFIGITLYLNVNFIYAGDISTLDLSKPTNPAEFVLDPEKGYWVETYNATEKFRQIEFGLFSLTHIPTGFGGNDVGGGMSYWDGFTYCTSGDKTNYGISGNSDGWITQQWGCMAGGGIQTDASGNVLKDNNGKVQVKKGIPYLVAYWGYWVETVENGDPCLQINFTDNELYEPVGMYVNNHPWPYYGNIYGDGFATPFTKEGDFFKLIIHGFNEDKEDIGETVEYMLAEFKDGELHQSADWEWIDLSAFGTVSGIYFTMESSDMHPNTELGPNTAVYFCMDKLTIQKPAEDTRPSRPTGLKATPDETTIDMQWNASGGSARVKGYNLYLNGAEGVFTENTEYKFSGLSPYTEYTIGIEAISTDDKKSPKASVKIRTTDVTPPKQPGNLQGVPDKNTITLTWDASTDNVAVTEYHIYLDGERQKRVYDTTYTLTGLDPATSYFIEVEARDESGNRSTKASATVMTKDEDNSLDLINEKTHIYYQAAGTYIYVESTEETSLEVFDITGSLIFLSPISSGENQVFIGHLPKGIYLVKCNSNILKINR